MRCTTHFCEPSATDSHKEFTRPLFVGSDPAFCRTEFLPFSGRDEFAITALAGHPKASSMSEYRHEAEHAASSPSGNGRSE